eukprot:m.1065046 g.1065046  ORF g.1065046 m.1065046 type:complete len:64 (+) comp24218_c2_seq57:3572-3763(+)
MRVTPTFPMPHCVMPSKTLVYKRTKVLTQLLHCGYNYAAVTLKRLKCRGCISSRREQHPQSFM